MTSNSDVAKDAKEMNTRYENRVVTASIGLKMATIATIQAQATAAGISFSAEGRRLVELALATEAADPTGPAPTSEPEPTPEPDLMTTETEGDDAPV